MSIEALLGILLATAICALLALLAAMLCRTRHSILGYVGAGLFGREIGAWIGGALRAMHWPATVSFMGSSVHLLWTFVGALLIVLVFKLLPRAAR